MIDVEQFSQRADADQLLNEYLEVIHEEAAPLVPDRTANGDLFLFLLSLLSVNALYLWLGTYAATGQGPDADALYRQLGPRLDGIVAQGFSRQEAEDAARAVSKAVAIRPPDDEARNAGLVVLRGEQNP